MSERPLPLLLAASALLLALLPTSARAHGDDQLLLDALTEELAKAPEADLYLRRGELFRHHQEWAKADADYVAAAKLDPLLSVVDYFRARVFLESGEAERARPFIERYVKAAPNEAEAWFLRGDVRAALGAPEAGALDYAEGLRRAANPRAEHYLRRARFLAAIPGVDSARILAALDEGIARVGPMLPLVDYAIELELDRRSYDAALARIDGAMQHAPRRETWLVRRGEVLVKAGRTKDAAAAYRTALAAIDNLPPRYRETVPMEKLTRDARTALDRISAQ